MKSRSTLRGANNSVGHGNLLTILTVTEIMARGIGEIGMEGKRSFRGMGEQVDVLDLKMHILQIWVTCIITMSPSAS